MKVFMTQFIINKEKREKAIWLRETICLRMVAGAARLACSWYSCKAIN